MAFKRRTAIVTGASRGIGRAVAIALARQHYAVWALARAAAVTGAAYPVDAGETL
jgi:NAD(P)-dependent dehydrogenase (short-subunit alcohol dehydrogenase family)